MDLASKTKFDDALRSSQGESTTICCVEPKAIIELLDLDELTTIKEVTTVIDSTMERRNE